MPRLVQFYIRQVILGFGLSALFVGLLMGFNVANLWHLVSGSDMGLLALIMLWVFNGVVFAGVQFGISIMRMDQFDGGSGGGRQQPLVQQTAPVVVPAQTQNTNQMLRRR